MSQKADGQICLMPWLGLNISGNGSLRPCCQTRGDHPNVHLTKDSIPKLYNAPFFKKLRNQFVHGERPSACSSCWEREEQIGYSRRIWFQEKFAKNLDTTNDLSDSVEFPQWVQADINLSNRCNLKCRMCGVWGSDKWISDEKKLSQINSDYRRESRDSFLKTWELSIDQLNSIVPHLEKTKRIDFKGGEPMLARNHIPFLQMLIDRGLNKNLTLHYTTNGTVVNEEILKYFNLFKKVNISISIEGTEGLYSYIRGGRFTTEDLENTLFQYNKLDNVSLMANVAIQAYNLANLLQLHGYLQGLEEKFEKFSASGAFNCIVNSPSYLSPFVWPLVYRKKVARQLSSIVDFREFCRQLNERENNLQEFLLFKKFTSDLDSIRSESFESLLKTNCESALKFYGQDIRDYSTGAISQPKPLT